jgi:hypothetical protein
MLCSCVNDAHIWIERFFNIFWKKCQSCFSPCPRISVSPRLRVPASAATKDILPHMEIIGFCLRQIVVTGAELPPAAAYLSTQPVVKIP